MAEQTSLNLGSELIFGSFLVYSPRGSSIVSRNSRDVCYNMKQDRGGAIAKLVARLEMDFAETRFGEMLGGRIPDFPEQCVGKDGLWRLGRLSRSSDRRGGWYWTLRLGLPMMVR